MSCLGVNEYVDRLSSWHHFIQHIRDLARRAQVEIDNLQGSLGLKVNGNIAICSFEPDLQSEALGKPSYFVEHHSNS